MNLTNPYFDFLQRFQNNKGQLAILPPQSKQLKELLKTLPIGWYSNCFHLVEPAFYTDIKTLLEPFTTESYDPFAVSAFGDLFLKNDKDEIILLLVHECKAQALGNDLSGFLNNKLYLHPALKTSLCKQAARNIDALSSQQMYQFKLSPLMGGEWSIENLKIHPFLETLSENLKILKIFDSDSLLFTNLKKA